MTSPDSMTLKMRGCIILILIGFSTVINQFVRGQVNFEVVDPVSGTGCNPLTVTFRNTSSVTDTKSFVWNFGDGSSEEIYDETNIGQDVIHTYTIPGEHQVSLTWTPNTGTKDILIQFIEVYNVDVPQAQASAQVLCGGDVIFSNISDKGITPGARTTIWDFGDGTSLTAGEEDVTHTYSFTADSTYTVKMTDINQCGSDSITLQVTIYDLDNQIIASPDTACINNGILFSNAGHKDQMIYLWDFSDGNTSAEISPVHEYASDGTYNLTMFDSIPSGQQCSGTSTIPVTILPGAKAEFAILYDTTCDLAEVTYSNTGSVGGQFISEWDFGNGETFSGQEPVDIISYDSAGSYRVTLITEYTSNGCSDTATQILFIPSSPIAMFSADNVCLGLPAQFTDLSIADAFTPVINWSWDFGAGQNSSDQHPSLVFASPGPQSVTLSVATNYCSDDTMIIVVVEDLPHPAFTLSATEGCSPLEALFTNNTPDAISYEWIFGDGETDTTTSPVHQFLTQAGRDTVYNTNLVASTLFGCRDSLSVPITVHFTPEALFTHDASVIPFCTRDTVTFTSLTVAAETLEWDFDNGTTGSDSIETCIFENNDYYFRHFLVSLVAVSVNGCRDTSETVYISLYPRPRSEFVPDTSDNCHPATIGFFAPVEADAQYTWNFGDGSTLQTGNYEITHLYQNTSQQDLAYPVKLTTNTQFGCTDSTTKQITVHANPQAGFTLSPNPANTSETVSFTNSTLNDPDWYYRWQLELKTGIDSVISFEPSDRAFDTYFDIPVTLLVRNEYECADTVTDTLDIIPPPPQLDYSPDTLQGCPPLIVTFTDLSQYTDTTTYLWDFGDGGYSTSVNPVHTFYDNGMYNVTLTAMGLDLSTMNKDTMISIFPEPSAAFSYFPEEVFVPDDPVKCVPAYPSSGESYSWDFGVPDTDGDTSSMQEPIYYYQDTGIYKITFIVFSEYNCPDTLVKTIRTRGTGKLKAPNVFFAGGGGGSGGGAGGGGEDGAIIDDGSIDNDVFAPLSEGVIDYHLEVYTRWGEMLFSSDVKNYGWTGYYHGKLCKEDVYVWKVSGTYSNGESFIEAGTITLLHNE